VKADEKDKPAEQPDGAFMLQGSMEFDAPVEVTLLAGQRIGIAIRRNKNKTSDKAPDYFGEMYTLREQPQGGA